MNRIFFTGTAKDVKIFLTPKGERVALFPVKVEDFATIQVLFFDSERKIDEKELEGKNVMILGTLLRPEREDEGVLRVKAKKIELLED